MVIAFTVLFVVQLIRVVFGTGDGPAKVERSSAEWTVWLGGLGFMVVGALFAVKALQAKLKADTVRYTRLCGALWGVGFILYTVYSNMLDPLA